MILQRGNPENMFDELYKLSESDIYPFHMPGHKRRLSGFNPYSIDITEIDGFDNMHEPEGLIAALNEGLKKRFGGERAFILINGSTSGVLTAISASLNPGEKLLLDRNSHKSAFDALYLRRLEAVFICHEKIGISPEEILAESIAPESICTDDRERFLINGGISPEKVEDALKKDRDIKAVFITSPTYEGFTSDVSRIAGICHAHGVPLIVDSAHGAHAGLHRDFTEEYRFENSALSGADIVIKSLHKTLPAFTQTALISVSGSLIDMNCFRRFYSVFQSSSPSYIFMAGADRMLKLLNERGEELFLSLGNRLKDLRKETGGNRRIRFFGPELMGRSAVYGFDPTKLLLTASHMTGKELYDVLRVRYHLQPEMAADRYVLLMTSIMDDNGGFSRLKMAVSELEKEAFPEPEDRSVSGTEGFFVETVLTSDNMDADRRAESSETTEETAEGKKEVTALKDAKGRISADFISVFPPGVPLIIPGERFSGEIIDRIEKSIRQGLKVKGVLVSK